MNDESKKQFAVRGLLFCFGYDQFFWDCFQVMPRVFQAVAPTLVGRDSAIYGTYLKSVF